jgi:AraC-like DNA-binding protein
MRYQEFHPGPAASRFVASYWMLEDDASSGAPQRVVPDGHSELILNLRQPYQSLGPDGWQTQPTMFLAGQITGPLLLRATAPAKMLGINFHPHTVGDVLSAPIPETTGRIVALDDLSSRLSRELGPVREIIEERGDEAGIRALDAAMATCRACPDARVAGVAQLLEQSGGMVEMDEVARQVGLSRRQIERQFQQRVGMAPKFFGRIQRFQQVLRAMNWSRNWSRDNIHWVDTAIRCGYYDQAHLIRDFRQFSGQPPAAFVQEGDLAEHFYRRLSHFSKTQAGHLR